MRPNIIPALLLAACACGSEDVDPLAKRDAGTSSRDGGVVNVDAGPVHDAGPPRDAGPSRDAGTRDAGTSRDAGTPIDAGTRDGGPRDGGLDCSMLQRDVCLATPGCVLDGSETRDPGYFCREARSPCEQIIDPTQCAADSACVAIAGRCYCPEGQECICGGGPGPVCREICGGFVGTPCPNANFFCDLPQSTSPTGPVCIGNADQQGTCTPFPPTCQGTPQAPACGCDGNFIATDFANDCERRLAGAHTSRTGMCP